MIFEMIASLALVAAELSEGASWFEAERALRQEGSTGEDTKSAASDGRVLGSDFGAKAGHYAEWRITIAEPIPDARWHVRYARAPADEATWDLFLGGSLVGRSPSLRLPGTGGWGEPAREWRWASAVLSDLSTGDHVLRIVATKTPDNTNFDGFFVSGPSFIPPVDAEALFRLTEEPVKPPAKPAFRTLPAPPRVARPKLELPSEVVASLGDRRLSRVLQGLARKSTPYVLKAHDVGAPTDYDADFVWHDLMKEKLFDLPARGSLGLVNPNSDLSVFFGIGSPSTARCIVHVVDALAYEVILENRLKAEVLWQVMTSQTLRGVVVIANEGSRDVTVPVTLVLAHGGRDPVIPVQRYGYGATVTAGPSLEAWTSEPPGLFASVHSEWQPAPRRPRPVGYLLAAMAPSEPVSLVEVKAGQRAATSAAIDLSRFAMEEIRTPRGNIQCFALSPEDAASRAAARLERALSDPDWETPLRASLSRYEAYPAVRLPDPDWEPHVYASLELPRAETYSPHGSLPYPFYNFCRAHAMEPWSWWSYGMHGHEDLSTLFLNYTDPSLSAAFLRGHFLMQAVDGGYPYGVSPYTRRVTTCELQTAPLLGVEAWTAYLWSGDEVFLREAYESVARSHCNWTATRDRTGEGLCHWANFLETVRDDPDLPTWLLSGGAEYQEALDLNCYLLREAQVLAEMANEISDPKGAARWREEAARRARLMNGYFWHAADRVYYGRSEIVDQWIDVKDLSTFLPLWAGLADPARAESLVAQLADPQTFATPFPVPTLARNEPLWGSLRHWHGSNWVEMSFLVVQGLRRYGYFKEAAKLSEVNCRMVFDLMAKTGHFREYYDALDGGPEELGRGVLLDYIWSAFPAAFLVEGILGVEARPQGLAVLPALPDGWPSGSIEGLSIRGRRVGLAVRRDPDSASASATLDGEPAPCALHGRGVLVEWSALKDGAQIEITLPPEGRIAPVRIWPGIGTAPAADAVPPHTYPTDSELKRKVLERIRSKESLR